MAYKVCLVVLLSCLLALVSGHNKYICDDSLPYAGNNARVLGAGVIGLSNAIALQKLGFRVTVYARTIPSTYDVETDSDPYYASVKAGAWIAPALSTKTADLKMMEDTYYAFFGMNITEPSSNVMRRNAKLLFKKMPTGDDYVQKTSVSSYGKGFRNLTKAELSAWGNGVFPYGITWETTVVDSYEYMKFLEREFRVHGGKFVIKNISHISDLTDMDDTDLVLNCAGLGARELGGVEDDKMYPIRGQLIMVRQPQVTDIYRVDGSLFGEDPGWGTYVLPRKSGIIILGGTRTAKDEDFTVRSKDKADILNRTKFVVPKLANATFVKDVVCMRPGRNGTSPRIDLDTTYPAPLIHCYGHSGSGFEKSWGSWVEVHALIAKLGLKKKQCPSQDYLPGWVVPVVAVGYSVIALLILILVAVFVTGGASGGGSDPSYTAFA